VTSFLVSHLKNMQVETIPDLSSLESKKNKIHPKGKQHILPCFFPKPQLSELLDPTQAFSAILSNQTSSSRKKKIIMTPTQTSCTVPRETPQNDHTFASTLILPKWLKPW